jgi:hypothetical protein
MKSWLVSYSAVIVIVAVRGTLENTLILSFPSRNLGKMKWLLWSRVYNVHVSIQSNNFLTNS